MRGAATTPAERAFTLIEMIVVLILLGLAMVAIFPAVANMMGTGSRASAVSQAGSEATLASRLLEYDLRRALGDRGTGDRSDTFNFGTQQAIRIATIPALASGNPRYVDVVRATPTLLEINADVYTSAAHVGVERVRWELRRNRDECGDYRRGANFCLVRTVFPPGSTNPITIEVPVKGRGAYPPSGNTCAGTDSGTLPAIAARVFCYKEAYPNRGIASATNPSIYTVSWTPACTSRYLTVGQSPNSVTGLTLGATNRFTTRHNRVDNLGSTSIHRLDRIVEVNASIIAAGAFGRASERSYEHVSVAIRSRESEAYREAIMCGTRAGWGR